MQRHRDDAGADEEGAAADDQPDDLTRRRAKGDPDANLASALRDQIRHHAIDPDRGQ